MRSALVRGGMARLAVLPLFVLPVLVGATSSAFATWSTPGQGIADGAAYVMPTGSAPTGAATGDIVSISWSPSLFPDGAPVAGYVINRINDATGAQGTVRVGCAGVVTATSCTESSVPPGNWIYTVTPVQMNWTGATSPPSGPITVRLT
jgi:hypothetical protein